MSLLQIDASDGTPRLFQINQPLPPAIASAMRQTSGPVTLLIHGYKYLPGHPDACPHRGLFALQSSSRCARVIAWPRHLHTGGLLIGFGWAARAGLRQVYDRAPDAARALADLITTIRHIDPSRHINLMCHSMGARVALCALPMLPAGAVHHLLMLAAAEYRSVASSCLQSPAGCAAQVWHVTSGENDLYDFLFERLIPAPMRRDTALGTAPLAGLDRILLDDEDTLTRLGRLGFRIAPPARRICHWSPYLRGGVFGLYSALLGGALSSELLRLHLPDPDRRRWSRVCSRPPAPPLPIPTDASL